MVTSALLLTAGGFLALSVKASLPLWLALAAAVFVVFGRWHTQPLAPLTSKQITASRIAEASMLTLLLASMFG